MRTKSGIMWAIFKKYYIRTENFYNEISKQTAAWVMKRENIQKEKAMK